MAVRESLHLTKAAARCKDVAAALGLDRAIARFGCSSAVANKGPNAARVRPYNFQHLPPTAQRFGSSRRGSKPGHALTR